MESKQTITERILEDAAKESAENERSATEKKNKTISAAREKAEEILTTEKAKIAADAENILSGKRTLAALEKRKAVLECRQQIVGSVYGKVESKLAAMPKTEYLAFIDRLISENGEKGDDVVYDESAPFNTEDVLSLASVKKIGAKVSRDKIGGGVILIGKSYDKKLTFSAIVADLRERTETATAEKLFGQQE